jgi:uncharacterized membrane protein YqiK
VVLLAFGAVLVAISAILLAITNLYVKTDASEAYVRNGLNGKKVIKDGGAFFVSAVHKLVRVPLHTIKYTVEKSGQEAFMTADRVRVDIAAEFFVKVDSSKEGIMSAAESIGSSMNSGSALQDLVMPKLVSALRNAAVSFSLEKLYTDRKGFLEVVVGGLTSDLAANGLKLETATISKLDQTPADSLRADNMFDAEGIRTIAEKTEKMRTEANEFKRAGEESRRQRDVEQSKRMLELQQQEESAKANQTAEVAKIQAEKSREAQEAGIERDRQLELAQVEKSKTTEVATREQQRAIEVAEREKQQAVTAAEQQLEVARRQKEQAIADAEARRAVAEAKLADAEAEREKARQSVKTVEVTAEAEREQQKQLIKAKADAEQKLIGAQKAADASAYSMLKEAEAKQKAAEAEAAAITRRATAEADAKKLNAEATKMEQLIPVEVKARDVEVEQERIEKVLKPELQARQTDGAAAQEFELAQLRISKEAEVKIETARAVVSMVSKIEAKVFGTPATVGQMINSMSAGMGLAQSVEGFREVASDETMEALGQGVSQLTALAGGLASHLGLKPEILLSGAKGKQEKNEKDGVLTHSR